MLLPALTCGRLGWGEETAASERDTGDINENAVEDWLPAALANDRWRRAIDLRNANSVTTAAWRAIAPVLRSPQSALEKLELEQWAGLKGSELDRENSSMWQSIYRNLREESAKLAESEGYDYIIVNDGTNDIMTNREVKVPLAQQVLEQIGRRHMIFASPSTDVSDKLIVRMNNSHATAPASVGPAKK